MIHNLGPRAARIFEVLQGRILSGERASSALQP
jgi:hypothetical protein